MLEDHEGFLRSTAQQHNLYQQDLSTAQRVPVKGTIFTVNLKMTMDHASLGLSPTGGNCVFLK